MKRLQVILSSIELMLNHLPRLFSFSCGGIFFGSLLAKLLGVGAVAEVTFILVSMVIGAGWAWYFTVEEEKVQ